jgi:hypothetical protein
VEIGDHQIVCEPSTLLDGPQRFANVEQDRGEHGIVEVAQGVRQRIDVPVVDFRLAPDALVRDQ